MKNIWIIGIGILIGLLLSGLIWLVLSPPRGEPVTLLPTPTSVGLVVYVTGAVAEPGVYTLPEHSRVQAAIDAAGGFLTSADKEDINLAAMLQDGDQIDVPAVGGESHARAGRININAATFEELDSLPGIGSTAAQNIVDYRLQHGPFASIEAIQDVPGIGPATYEEIKDLITIGY